jgi:hypothetical protein
LRPTDQLHSATGEVEVIGVRDNRVESATREAGVP